MSSHPNTAGRPQRTPQASRKQPPSDSSQDEDSDEYGYDEDGKLVLGKRDRKENGLVTLTHRFIALLKRAP